MKRAWLLVILSCSAMSTVMGQAPIRRDPKWHKVAADEAPTNSVTPDGKYRFYVEEDGQGDQIFLRHVKTLETHRLTNGPGETDFNDPIMSPDGSLVAYAWVTPAYAVMTEDRLIELRIVGIGTEPRVLYSNRNVLLLLVHEWSPDGKYIAATVFQKDRTSELVLISVADASVRVLRTQGLKTLNYNYQWNRASFSPDGRFIAYDLTPQGGWYPRDIFAIPVEGGPEIPLVQRPANDLLLGWTHDGREVLFASDRSGHWDLWIIEVSDGKPRGSPKLVKPNIGPIFDGLGFTGLGLTRNGSYYYKAWVPEIELYVATVDPATNRLHGPSKLAKHVGYNTSTEWSRDGQYLAYAWGRGSAYEPFVLGIRSPKTGNERRFRLDNLMRHGGHGFEPRWSPDGRFILGTARERNYAGPLMDSQGLYRIDVQIGSFTPLVQTMGICGMTCIESPVWSPDGRAIFKRRATQSIMTRDIETGEEKELYRAVPPDQVRHWPTSNLAVSPNGQRLVFVLADGKEGVTALMVVPTAGGEPRELLRVHEPEVISVPGWMPDSRHIIYASGVAGEKPKFELWRVSADGGEPQNLGLRMQARVPYGLSVHPDGKRIAFTVGTQRRDEVWVLENLVPMLKNAKSGAKAK